MINCRKHHTDSSPASVGRWEGPTLNRARISAAVMKGLFVYSLGRYLLNTYYVAGTGLRAWGYLWGQPDKGPAPMEFKILSR